MRLPLSEPGLHPVVFLQRRGSSGRSARRNPTASGSWSLGRSDRCKNPRPRETWISWRRKRAKSAPFWARLRLQWALQCQCQRPTQPPILPPVPVHSAQAVTLPRVPPPETIPPTRPNPTPFRRRYPSTTMTPAPVPAPRDEQKTMATAPPSSSAPNATESVPPSPYSLSPLSYLWAISSVFATGRRCN